jgi:hypothetical protein
MRRPTTSITKPAGCGLQLVGSFLALIGIGLLMRAFEGGLDGERLFWALIVFALGVWVFRLGRLPALPPREH